MYMPYLHLIVVSSMINAASSSPVQSFIVVPDVHRHHRREYWNASKILYDTAYDIQILYSIVYIHVLWTHSLGHAVLCPEHLHISKNTWSFSLPCHWSES